MTGVFISSTQRAVWKSENLANRAKTMYELMMMQIFIVAASWVFEGAELHISTHHKHPKPSENKSKHIWQKKMKHSERNVKPSFTVSRYKYEQTLKRGLSAINGSETQYLYARQEPVWNSTAKLSGPKQTMTTPFSLPLHPPQFSCLQQNDPFQKQ